MIVRLPQDKKLAITKSTEELQQTFQSITSHPPRVRPIRVSKQGLDIPIAPRYPAQGNLPGMPKIGEGGIGSQGGYLAGMRTDGSPIYASEKQRRPGRGSSDGTLSASLNASYFIPTLIMRKADDWFKFQTHLKRFHGQKLNKKNISQLMYNLGVNLNDESEVKKFSKHMKRAHEDALIDLKGNVNVPESSKSTPLELKKMEKEAQEREAKKKTEEEKEPESPFYHKQGYKFKTYSDLDSTISSVKRFGGKFIFRDPSDNKHSFDWNPASQKFHREDDKTKSFSSEELTNFVKGSEKPSKKKKKQGEGAGKMVDRSKLKETQRKDEPVAPKSVAPTPAAASKAVVPGISSDVMDIINRVHQGASTSTPVTSAAPEALEATPAAPEAAPATPEAAPAPAPVIAEPSRPKRGRKQKQTEPPVVSETAPSPAAPETAPPVVSEAPPAAVSEEKPKKGRKPKSEPEEEKPAEKRKVEAGIRFSSGGSEERIPIKSGSENKSAQLLANKLKKTKKSEGHFGEDSWTYDKNTGRFHNSRNYDHSLSHEEFVGKVHRFLTGKPPEVEESTKTEPVKTEKPAKIVQEPSGPVEKVPVISTGREPGEPGVKEPTLAPTAVVRRPVEEGEEGVPIGIGLPYQIGKEVPYQGAPAPVSKPKPATSAKMIVRRSSTASESVISGAAKPRAYERLAGLGVERPWREEPPPVAVVRKPVTEPVPAQTAPSETPLVVGKEAPLEKVEPKAEPKAHVISKYPQFEEEHATDVLERRRSSLQLRHDRPAPKMAEREPVPPEVAEEELRRYIGEYVKGGEHGTKEVKQPPLLSKISEKFKGMFSRTAPGTMEQAAAPIHQEPESEIEPRPGARNIRELFMPKWQKVARQSTLIPETGKVIEEEEPPATFSEPSFMRKFRKMEEEKPEKESWRKVAAEPPPVEPAAEPPAESSAKPSTVKPPVRRGVAAEARADILKRPQQMKEYLARRAEVSRLEAASTPAAPVVAAPTPVPVAPVPAPAAPTPAAPTPAAPTPAAPVLTPISFTPPASTPVAPTSAPPKEWHEHLETVKQKIESGGVGNLEKINASGYRLLAGDTNIPPEHVQHGLSALKISRHLDQKGNITFSPGATSEMKPDEVLNPKGSGTPIGKSMRYRFSSIFV